MQGYLNQNTAPDILMQCSGTGPISPMRTWFMASLSAPESSRAWTTSAYPCWLAFIRAVQPPCTRKATPRKHDVHLHSTHKLLHTTHALSLLLAVIPSLTTSFLASLSACRYKCCPAILTYYKIRDWEDSSTPQCVRQHFCLYYNYSHGPLCILHRYNTLGLGLRAPLPPAPASSLHCSGCRCRL